MKRIRNSIFETNSSSTHSLVISNALGDDYLPYGDTLKIEFFDEEHTLVTLKDKVSYLVSHIVSWYDANAEDYEDLIRQVENDWQFKRIASYVQENFGKRIVFPEKMPSYLNEDNGEEDEGYNALEDLVDINHQLRSWDHSLDEVLEDLYDQDVDYLAEVLADGKIIQFGRD